MFLTVKKNPKRQYFSKYWVQKLKWITFYVFKYYQSLVQKYVFPAIIVNKKHNVQSVHYFFFTLYTIYIF